VEDNKYYYELPTQKNDAANSFSLPLKIHLNLTPDANLTAGALLNPSTGDMAKVAGNGAINLTYDLNDASMNLQGNYLIDNGKCSVSLRKFTTKDFSIQNGSKLTFNGDPMKTAFNVTAEYGLKANPATLDAGFAELVSYAKIPVTCCLTASGNLDKMKLDYRIVLPDESDDIQKKLDNLLVSEDIKMKQIAYLLAFGSFAPIENSSQDAGGNSNIWTSLASSSVSSQLNNLLSGVLKDNWTIGTDLHSQDGSFSNVTMDVNISTSLFNDRLTVNSTLGFKNNNAVQTDNQTNNFTGDFDLEYKLSPAGNVLLHFFNLTNSQFYEKAKTTQGAGIVYKRKGKTFKQLFRTFRTKKRQKD